MKRTPLYLALAGITLTAGYTPVFAQEAIEEIVVTGSFIPGTPEDAAVPVDVTTSEDMSKIGTPDMLEFIKNMPASSGVLGAQNQFDADAQGSDGAGSVNLRGLGPERTLVLINGKRVANNPFTDAVDTNLLPLAAMGRLEVLKDGAAVLYGSDAIGGVVNFITKKNFEGFEVGYDHRFIQDSRGEDTFRANWGWVGDNTNVLISAGYQKQHGLSAADRDWGLKPFSENELGGWSGGGNPTGFLPESAGYSAAASFNDPGCADLGGTQLRQPLSDPTIPRCRFEYTPFDNLQDPQERYQLYSEVNGTFGPDLNWHLEGMYSNTELEYYTSPSYLATQTPTLTGSIFSIPGNHPGLADFRNRYGNEAVSLLTDGLGPATGDVSTLVPAGQGLGQAALTFRPYAIGGNPLYGFDAAQSTREYDQARISTGLEGMIGDTISWDVDVTYSEVKAYRDGSDTVVDRYQAALLGMGGPNCNLGAGGIPFDSSTGCLTYSPFSTSIRLNALTDQPNPNFVNAYDNENPELINWMFVKHGVEDTSTNLTVDAVFNGDLGVELPGGMIQWAAGVQYRDDSYERQSDDINNLALNPCAAAVETALTGIATAPFTTCEAAGQSAGSGPFFFLGGTNEVDLERDVYAVFSEFRAPITDTLELTLAARFEDYGGETGDTFDPKAALRWQATDWLAIRTSYSSTFRAPPINIARDSIEATSLQNINSTFRPIDTFGDAALQPEEADTVNFGAIFETGGLFASLDYWYFDFSNPLVTDPLTPMVDALFGDPDDPSDDNCGTSAYAGLENRFTFDGGVCDIGNIARVRVNWLNGSARETDGIDWKLSHAWSLDTGDTVTLGTQGTYTLSYDFEAVEVEGIQVEASRDAAGFLNAQASGFPLPELKGNVYGEFTSGDHNTRLVANYVDSYQDQRFNQPVDEQITYDLHYRVFWNTDLAETTINISAENLTDEDPPFVRLDFDYDPFTHSALGRTFKMGFTSRF